jgi:hypothetical protein
MEFVNGKDDIPYMIYGKYKNVPNHQPDDIARVNSPILTS